MDQGLLRPVLCASVYASRYRQNRKCADLDQSLLLANYMASYEALNFFEPQFLHLSNEINNVYCVSVFVGDTICMPDVGHVGDAP